MATSTPSTHDITDSEFMEIVRSYRVLYDKGSTEFKNKDMKANAWKEVAEKSFTNPQLAIKRYETIRSGFGRYLKSQKPPSGSGRDAIAIDGRFEHLRWLMPYIRHRDNVTSNVPKSRREETSTDIPEGSTSTAKDNCNEANTVVNIDDDEEQQAALNSPAGSSVTVLPRPWSRGAKRAKVVDVPEDALSTEIVATLRKLEDHEPDTVDECGSFCNSMATKMRRLTPYKQAMAQQRILSLMIDLEYNTNPTAQTPTHTLTHQIQPPTHHIQQPAHHAPPIAPHQPDFYNPASFNSPTQYTNL